MLSAFVFVLSLLPGLPARAASAELVRLLESPIGRFVLLETEAGARITTATVGEKLGPGADLAPLLRRLDEPELSELSRRLEGGLRDVETVYRERFPRAGAQLGKAQKTLLRDRALHSLNIETRFFPVAVSHGGYEAGRAAFLRGFKVEGHRWQERIWTLRESGQAEAAAKLEKSIEQLLERETIVEKTVLGGGATETFLVRFADGTRAVFKPAQQAHWAANAGHEVGAYRFDRLLGFDLAPVTVMRTIDGQTGSLQLFMPESQSGALSRFGPSRRMSLYDYLIGNTDRHDANFLVLEAAGGRQVAIDHGLAFSLETDPPYLFNPIKPDRAMYHRLRDLDPRRLERELSGLVEADRVRALLERREHVLERVRSALGRETEASYFGE